MALLPPYEVQLNAYAYIGERLGLSPIHRLALVYVEPVIDEHTASTPSVVDNRRFSMGFAATIVDVDLKPDQLVPRLPQKAKGISELDRSPSASPRCRDCGAVNDLMGALNPEMSS